MKHRVKAVTIFLSCLMMLGVSLRGRPASAGSDSGSDYLYKVSFVRAAPGKLLELIDLYKNRMAVFDAAGDERPMWWRHTQGDQWDLMMIFPMGGYSEFYAPARVTRRSRAAERSALSESAFKNRFYECASWHEDLFVTGPSLETVKTSFQKAAYFHVEIFIALPGKRAELYREREMENAYQKGIGRPETMIFTRDQGAAWDIFTLGCYRDLKHWAESEDVSREKREAAARAAGFDGPDKIGPYMRSLIVMHRDTMGVAIK